MAPWIMDVACIRVCSANGQEANDRDRELCLGSSLAELLCLSEKQRGEEKVGDDRWGPWFHLSVALRESGGVSGERRHAA